MILTRHLSETWNEKGIIELHGIKDMKCYIPHIKYNHSRVLLNFNTMRSRPLIFERGGRWVVWAIFPKNPAPQQMLSTIIVLIFDVNKFLHTKKIMHNLNARRNFHALENCPNPPPLKKNNEPFLSYCR